MSAEVLVGWNGMYSAYHEMIDTLNPGDYDYVIGASAGRKYDEAKAFYEQVMEKAYHKGIKFKVLSQERIRTHFEKFKGPTKHLQIKYLQVATYSEINIYNDTILIVIHGETPTIVKIVNSDVAKSHLEYFKSLWKQANK